MRRWVDRPKMPYSPEVRHLKDTMGRYTFNLSVTLHSALTFFLSHARLENSLEEWEIFEHFIRRVARKSILNSLQSEQIGKIHCSIARPEAMLIKKTDLKIQIDGLETIYFLIPYQLLCQFTVICEAKYHHAYSKRLAYELMAFNSKADYTLYHRSLTLLSHLHRSSVFCGSKYIVTSCDLPRNFQRWLLTCGVIPITPDFSIISSIGDNVDNWKFILFMSNFNRLIGKTNKFVPYQWQVQHTHTFYEMALNFVVLLDDRKKFCFTPLNQRQLFEKTLKETTIGLRNRKRIRGRG